MVGSKRLGSNQEKKLSRLSISLDEDLVKKFKDECDNNFIDDKLFIIPLKKIKIMGSGTVERGAYYSEIIRKLILEFLRSRDKNFTENYLTKEKRKHEEK